jgi:hypothetical protein
VPWTSPVEIIRKDPIKKIVIIIIIIVVGTAHNNK